MAFQPGVNKDYQGEEEGMTYLFDTGMTLAEQVHHRRCPVSEPLVARHVRVSERHLYLFADYSILVVDECPLKSDRRTMYILPGDSQYEYYLRQLGQR